MARALANRTATHGAGPATTHRLRCQVVAPTGRLLITGSGHYLPSYTAGRPVFGTPVGPRDFKILFLEFRRAGGLELRACQFRQFEHTMMTNGMLQCRNKVHFNSSICMTKL